MKPFSLSCACIFNARLDPPSSYVYHHHHHQLYQESKMIGQNPDLDSFTFSSLRTRLKIKITSEMEVTPRHKLLTLFYTAYIVDFAYIADTV